VYEFFGGVPTKWIKKVTYNVGASGSCLPGTKKLLEFSSSHRRKDFKSQNPQNEYEKIEQSWDLNCTLKDGGEGLK
jgi:hypothetical protein